ncbi:hypothetical protein J6590_001815 [Homalodisca vitripennis]|nr:hypothetical protein J6590_001815 [Homalodisca vitripennis]
MDDQEYSLRWNNHQPNFISVFKSLLELEELVDVTLSVEGKHIKAHKVILSACSPYFKESCRVVFKEWRLMTVINLYVLKVSLSHLQQPSTICDQHIYNTRYAENFSSPTHTKSCFAETYTAELAPGHHSTPSMNSPAGKDWND